jgi:hypothetical protein
MMNLISFLEVCSYREFVSAVIFLVMATGGDGASYTGQR